ncbi:E3 ubiquitin-protein ligase Topors-like [Oryctolagus cuniculus]|uniref:E3 ubiquitin-protein ligase Topors-like n=1 Tax=Oryctolagus cuniculus TaxID=9986 RepID=UPI0038791EC4
MPLELSSHCKCPNCVEGPENEANWTPSSSKSGTGSSYSRSRKTSRRHCSLSQCCPTRLAIDTKEESLFLPSENENFVGLSQNNHLNPNFENSTRKIRPLKELTIQELLQEFADLGKFQSDSMSLGHFRDQVVMKFRRALYYSGVWVTHVQGYRVEKLFSANYFKRNPGSLHRLVPWLKRELTAVYGDYGYTVKNILAAIIHHMTIYDLDSESFIHLLEPYLLQHTRHFLHEFISFVHSPYNMETYDQRAIYQCPAPEPWTKMKSTASAPILPSPKDHAVITQTDTKQSENTESQKNKRPVSGLIEFPNGNSSQKESEISPAHHKTASKIDIWIKDKPDSGDHKVTISTNNNLLNWATRRERDPNLPKCKKKMQEKKTQGIKLLPGHVQDPRKNETITCTSSTPAVSNEEQTWRHSLRERRVLSHGRQINVQENEGEETKYSDSSSVIFQRLPGQRSSVRHKSRKRDPSWSCISENTVSSKRDGRKLSSFRKRSLKCRQSYQFVDAGSYSSRRTQRRSRSSTRRSKSWCAGPRKRSMSRDTSTFFPRRSYRNEDFTKNICAEPSKEKKVHSNESTCGQATSTPGQSMKISSTVGSRPKYVSKGESASQFGSHCSKPICLHNEKHRSPNMQVMNQKITFPRARRTRAVKPGKHNCEYQGTQNTEEVRDELGSLGDKKQMSRFFVCTPSSRRPMPAKQNSSFQRCHCANTTEETSIRNRDVNSLKSKLLHLTREQGSLGV